MSPETQWVARIPRRVVIHRMETADCLDSRLFWAIVLWSVCGPQRSTQVVIKDGKGFIQKDATGNPVPASQKDLRELLGLAPGMKGHVSRAVQRLNENNSIRVDENKVISFEDSPPEVAPKDPKAVASTGNWNIAGVVASIGNFPSDPVARTEAIRWLENLSTEWRNNLKTLKTGYRKIAVQGLRERGILIGLEEKRRRGETATAEEVPQPVDPPPPEAPPAAAEPPGTPPEDEQLREALAPYGSADLDTARRIIARSRQRFPEATIQDILLMAKEKARSITASVKNPIALFVEVIPKGFEGYIRPKERGRAAAITETPEQRAQQIEFLRENWDAYTPEDQRYYSEQYPELSSVVKIE